MFEIPSVKHSHCYVTDVIAKCYKKMRVTEDSPQIDQCAQHLTGAACTEIGTGLSLEVS